ncbi:metallopeptidase TldD-related protein [Escherichia coli]
MQDKLNARLMGMTPTGNGRRESYAHLPMPRMTNTYMLPGKSTPRKSESVEYGIYAPNFGGGQWILHPQIRFLHFRSISD